jgi:hypothetical protein
LEEDAGIYLAKLAEQRTLLTDDTIEVDLYLA